jgi:hypothetical protein
MSTSVPSALSELRPLPTRFEFAICGDMDLSWSFMIFLHILHEREECEKVEQLRDSNGTHCRKITYKKVDLRVQLGWLSWDNCNHRRNIDPQKLGYGAPLSFRWNTPTLNWNCTFTYAPCITYMTTGWWFQSLWKIWKSVGMTIPNIWKNKIHVPNHRPDSVIFEANVGKYSSTMEHDGYFTGFTVSPWIWLDEHNDQKNPQSSWINYQQ